MKLFVPICKVDLERREVYGVAAEERVDRVKEKFDYQRSRPHFEKWSAEVSKDTQGRSLGNVRAQHGNVAAGKLIALTFNDQEKQIEVGAKIIDPVEWDKIKEGVYAGFSIGGRYASKWADPDDNSVTRYEAIPSEISIVDRPCMPGATFQAIKQDGTVEVRKFVGSEETREEEKPEQCVVCLRSQGDHDAAIAKGDVPGHEFHGNQHTGATVGGQTKGEHAARLTAKANTLSTRANKVGTEKAHRRAEEAHWTAHDAHKSAARAASRKGDHNAAAKHENEAARHYRVATAHNTAAFMHLRAGKKADSGALDKIHRPHRVKRDGKYKVVDDDGHVYGEHDTKDKANRQLAALYAAKEKESKAMTSEALKQVAARFIKAAEERKLVVPDEVKKDSLGVLDWIGSLKTRQAARALYIIGLLEQLRESERAEGEEHEDAYSQQDDMIATAIEQLQAFIPSELAEADEPAAAEVAVPTATPMAMADVIAGLAKVEDEELSKALGERLKALVHKGNHQEVHDHCVKAFGSKCAKADKAEPEGEIVKAEEPVVEAVVEAEVEKAKSDKVKCPECGKMVEPDEDDECPECGADLKDEEDEEKADVPTLAEAVVKIDEPTELQKAVETIKQEYAAKHEEFVKTAGEERATLQTKVDELEAKVAGFSKRIVEKQAPSRPVTKGGEGAGEVKEERPKSPSELAVPIIKSIRAEFGPEIAEAVAIKLGEALISSRKG